MTRTQYENLPCYYDRCDTFKKLERSGAEDWQLTVSCAHLALVGLGLDLQLRDECPVDRIVDVLQSSTDSNENGDFRTLPMST